ncbi:hypothetical protein UFOVP1290_180 [uncultured Caudovirales phage]|uniref:Uncharacterized protein n=1 Tax=uncultured Caudovirales phage TaxID=2100421 RepID=A0A6J5RGH8_9CAUD|nr:hypothetical protein UFOVP1290_180 [uncultured Caudovirales phage]
MKISMKVKSSVLIEKLEKRLAFYKQEAEKNKKVFEADSKKNSDAARKLLEKLLTDKSCNDFKISCSSSRAGGTNFSVDFNTTGPVVTVPSRLFVYDEHRFAIEQIEVALKVLRLNPDADVNAATHSDVLQYL